MSFYILMQNGTLETNSSCYKKKTPIRSLLSYKYASLNELLCTEWNIVFFFLKIFFSKTLLLFANCTTLILYC